MTTDKQLAEIAQPTQKNRRGIPSRKNPPWWPTAEQKVHADAGCAHPDVCRVGDCPLTCLNRLAPSCVIHRPAAEMDATDCRHCGLSITPHVGVGGVQWRDNSSHSPSVCLKARAVVHQPETTHEFTEDPDDYSMCVMPEHEVETAAIDLDRLRMVAAEAPEGPWVSEAIGSEGFVIYASETRPRRLSRVNVARCRIEDWETDKASAAYIATFDPPTVLALLDEIQQLRTSPDRPSGANDGE